LSDFTEMGDHGISIAGVPITGSIISAWRSRAGSAPMAAFAAY
jgi:hypothetical protein